MFPNLKRAGQTLVSVEDLGSAGNGVGAAHRPTRATEPLSQHWSGEREMVAGLSRDRDQSLPELPLCVED